VAEPDLIPVPDVAAALESDVLKVRQYLRDGILLGVRGEDGVLRIPAQFVAEGRIVKHLPGVLTLLKDNGYTEDESLRWLFTDDDSLPGSPIDALRENRGTEVKRRAQALGW
jgi:hypothetical protein